MYCPVGTRCVNVACVVSADVESQPAQFVATASRRSESGSVRYTRFTGSSMSSTLNLYLTGFCVDTPSGSIPVHWMQTLDAVVPTRSCGGTGAVIVTIGAMLSA